MDQSRPYVNFKKRRLGKRVDVDWTLGYQCVDLMRQYCIEVLGMQHKACGNAIDIWNNKLGAFDSSWSKFEGTDDLMQWDIIFANIWKCWHVGVVDCAWKGMIYTLEQNWWGKNSWDWLGGNAITVYWRNHNFRLGVRRCQKIFDNLQLERKYITDKLATNLSQQDRVTTLQYQQTIRYLADQTPDVTKTA